MNSKTTTDSQLSTTEPENKLSQQLQQEQNHRNGDYMHGYQREAGGGRMEEKVQGIRNINGRYKIHRKRLKIV